MIPIVKLGDICIMQSGGTPRRDNPSFYKNGTIPWIKIGDIKNAQNGWITETEESITELGLKSINNRIFPKGTLLFAMYGSVGKTALAGTVLSTNQAILGIQPKEEALNVIYLNYWLKSRIKEFKHLSRGVALKNLSATIMKEQKIPLPPLETQKKIAAILDKADELRRNDQKILEKYDQLGQSVFLEMFGDPVINSRNWATEQLNLIVAEDCPLTYGIVQPGDEIKGGVPIVRPVDLEEKYISIKGLKRIDPSISSKYKRTILKGNELLMSVRGSIAVISFATSEIKGANVTRGIVPIWMNPQRANDSFIYGLFKNSRFMSLVKGLAKGATLIQLNLKDLRELSIISPPIEHQNKFASILKKIEIQKQFTQQSLQKSEELFQSLLQRAFKGELKLASN